MHPQPIVVFVKNVFLLCIILFKYFSQHWRTKIRLLAITIFFFTNRQMEKDEKILDKKKATINITKNL